MKKFLSKEELMAEYGLGEYESRGSCTITLNCSFGSISCTSKDGKCLKHFEQFAVGDEVIDVVTAIQCDDDIHSCKKDNE